MKSKFIMLGVLLCVGLYAPAQQPFVMLAVKIDMQPSQIYNVFQLEDSTCRVFTRAGQIGSPVPYPPDGRYFDVSRDARQIPFHRPFPVSTLGEYLPGDYYYAGARYDSAGTRYSKVGLFNPQLKLMWQFTTPNNDWDLKLWPIANGQYLSLKQNGRILSFDKTGLIDSSHAVSYPNMFGSYIKAVNQNGFIYNFWGEKENHFYYDTLILVKCDLQGNTQSTYKYYQKAGLIFYSYLTPLHSKSGYELRFLTRTDSTTTLSYFNYKIITLDSNLSEVQVKEMDTALVNKYQNDYYYYTTYARLKHGFATLEQPRTPSGQISNGFIIDVYNDNWELQHQTYITDSIIKANSKEYKSFDVRPWVVDVMKTAKDSGLIIAGFYKVGMFPYETLPFLIKTDTAGRVVWQDAGLGDFPAGAAEPKAVTEHLVFYPNPAQDVLNYTVKTDGFDELEIVIYDLLGKEVIRTTANGHEGAINMLNLPNGLYLVTYMMQVGSTVINGTQKLMITN